jgi:hypothetical protein
MRKILIVLSGLFLFQTCSAQEGSISSHLLQGMHIDLHETTTSIPSQINALSLSKSAESKLEREARGKAFWRSLLVPGLGQIAEGRNFVGYVFLSTEVALISSLVGLRLYSSWLEDDYRQFAHQHAGVPSDREHQYFVDIGNWMDTRSFNDQRLRDRAFDQLYLDPDYQWQWDSNQNRLSFRSMRISSDQASNNAILVVGGLILNHLVSAVEAAQNMPKQTTISLLPTEGNGLALRLSYTR